jgi:DNA-binding transcriptional LysR family regulator
MTLSGSRRQIIRWRRNRRYGARPAQSAFIRKAGSGTRETLEHDAPWISIRVAMEPGSAEAIKQAVAARLGISVVSRVTIQIEPETRRLVLLPIADLTIRRSLTCVRHIDRPVSRALEAWLRMTSDDNETSPLSSGSQAPSP